MCPKQAFEADAVAVVIWNTLRTKPEGFARSRKDQEEIKKRSTSIPPKPRVVGRRLFSVARNYQPGNPGRCVGRAPTAFGMIAVALWESAQLKRR
jgi:hypothetical protein